MESFSDESFRLSYWDYFAFLLLRPIAAVVFALSVLFFGWFLAWKLVLVHVPLVQEIFSLRNKPVKPKAAARRRITEFYNRINAQNPSLEWNLLILLSAMIMFRVSSEYFLGARMPLQENEVLSTNSLI